MTHTSSEGSTLSADDLGVPPTPPRSPPAADDRSSRPHMSQPNPPPRTKVPAPDAYNKSMGQKKKKGPDCTGGVSRPAWNSSLKPKEDMKRRGSHTDISGGYAISRSRSTNSESGFQGLTRNSPARKSLSATRSSSTSQPRANGSPAKWSWSGRGNSRTRPPVNNEVYKPPAPPRGVRSASASPGPIRRNFGHSAPVTPQTRSPKTSAPNSNLGSPTHGGVKKIPDLVSDITDHAAEPSVTMLAQLEDLVNSYRARVLDHYAEEGKAPPAALANDFSCSWARDTQSLTNSPKRNIRSNAQQLEPPALKVTPRKSGLGSRIPAPTFYPSRNTPS